MQEKIDVQVHKKGETGEWAVYWIYGSDDKGVVSRAQKHYRTSMDESDIKGGFQGLLEASGYDPPGALHFELFDNLTEEESITYYNACNPQHPIQ